jgi:hypothetical protein
MIQEDVPASAARFFGHVCGVFAVAMAALGLWSLWQFAAALYGGGWSPGLAVLALIAVACAALLFRWAGVLIGHWPARGRLAVPAAVYVGLGVGAATVAAIALYLLLTHTVGFWASLKLLAGVVSGSVLVYWCWRLVKRQPK